jgi:hypothetical protein
MDRHHRAMLRLNRHLNVLGIHKRVLGLVDRTRFYVLMAALLNQLMVHHNVLSAKKTKTKSCQKIYCSN